MREQEAITQWRFTALEFSVLWQRIGYDMLPFPFSYIGTAHSQDQFQLMRRDAAASVDSVYDDDLEAALLTLAKPAAQVQVCGFSPNRSVIRMIAGVEHDRGTVAIQLPTRNVAFGADILLSTPGPRNVADAVIRSLPSARPGSGPAINVARRDLTPSNNTRVAYSIAADRVRTSALERLARPHTCFGDIIVGPRTVGGSRLADPSNGFQWVDYDEDGRYLVVSGNTISAVPAAGPVLVTELRNRLSKLVLNISG